MVFLFFSFGTALFEGRVRLAPRCLRSSIGGGDQRIPSSKANRAAGLSASPALRALGNEGEFSFPRLASSLSRWLPRGLGSGCALTKTGRLFREPPPLESAVGVRGFAISPLNPNISRGVLYPRVSCPYVLVVLTRDVAGLGAAGETVYVRRGLFRHKLAREGSALAATWQNIDRVAHELKRQTPRAVSPSSDQEGRGDESSQGAGEAPVRAAGVLGRGERQAAPSPSADAPDDEGSELSWVRSLRLRFELPCEPADEAQLLESLDVLDVLRKLSDSEELDLLPEQLFLLPKSDTAADAQPDAAGPSQQRLPEPLRELSRVGHYRVRAVFRGRSGRPFSRDFSLQVASTSSAKR